MFEVYKFVILVFPLYVDIGLLDMSDNKKFVKGDEGLRLTGFYTF